MQKQKSRVDVLVVGAGPTGLALACDLARRGLTFRIIDKGNAYPLGSRGKGIQPRSLEVFDDLGIVDAILAHAIDVDVDAGPRGNPIDVHGHVRHAYGRVEGALFLIRPDGYIGFIGDRLAPDAVAAYIGAITGPRIQA